jgi:hypothetical protein
MTQEGNALSPNTGRVSSIDGQVDPSSAVREDDGSKGEAPLPPQAVRMLMELTEMRASFGPDPETAKILAETERHAEEKKLEGYKATLKHRDNENERKHIRLLKKIGNESKRAWVVLIASIITAIGGIFLSITGRSNLGIPLLVFAGILIKDLSGKPSSSVDSE